MSVGVFKTLDLMKQELIENADIVLMMLKLTAQKKKEKKEEKKHLFLPQLPIVDYL